MPVSETVSPSASQVNKAASRLRKLMRGEDVDEELFARSLQVLLDWRADHRRPLTTANMGLRSMVAHEKCNVEVSQRLKRVPTILNKLERFPTMALASMQDIGGVRAVLADVDEIRRVEARIRRNRPPVGYSDYIATPRSSGYRGVHIVVQYHGRNIEIQLRTAVMHAWAITVERISGRLGENFKQDGHHLIQQLMSIISEAMATEEAGGNVDAAVQHRIASLRLQARPFLDAPWGG